MGFPARRPSDPSRHAAPAAWARTPCHPAGTVRELRPADPEQAERPGVLLLLLGLFAASGAAALIYEVVWFHLLRFTIGSSTLSLGILLASFMGGLCLGSLWYHRAVAARRHPLKVYALLEVGVGLCGVAIPLVLPLVTHMYVASAGSAVGDIAWRAALCAVLLVPPTILMGATLPAMSRWMRLTATGYSRLGFFYSANMVGAVIGAAAAGFYLVRTFDVYVATAAAVILNFVIAAAGSALARRHPHAPAERVEDTHGGWSLSTVQVVIGLSGLTALGAQVVWTRMLSLLLGGTVYVFSVILAVFLVGLAAGGAVGSACCRTSANPARLLAACQAMLIPAIPYAAYAITSMVPDLHVSGATDDWFRRSMDDVLRVAAAIAPATLCWGASFPLAVAAAGHRERDPGKLVGRLYAANTIGAIVGALAFSVAIVALVGTRQAQWILTVCAGLAAWLMLRATAAVPEPGTASPRRARPRTVGGIVAAATVLALSGIAGWLIPESHPGLIAYGRQVHRWNEPAEYLHVREGRYASVAISRTKEDGYRNFHINGKIEASTWPEDLRLQRMLGHLPALLHPDPKSVLIIGFGAGVTAGTFSLYPGIERIVIVEIEPEVLAASGRYFRDENYDVLNDPRTTVIHDDGRHYLTTTRDTFDLITTDPIHPWTKGASALYTKEFFTLSKAHLNPGGLISQWVPLYETSPEAVKSQVGTFLDVFPHGSIWNSEVDLKGYDVTLLGHVVPLTIDAGALRHRLDALENVRRSLSDVRIDSAADLLRAFAGLRRDVEAWLADYQPNLDRDLRLEYLAGEALNRHDEVAIYNDMTAELAYPDDVFRVDPVTEHLLRRTFRERYGTPERAHVDRRMPQ
ncbi:MAG: spermidine synthase [Nitrospirota bacterium]